jgi:DNA invertase Pin-like site-specific DNA recombinase
MIGENGHMETIGYARVSTTGQSLEVQIEELNKASVDRIFQEKASGATGEREQLKAMIDYVRQGDTVMCCKIDRIARSTQDLLGIVEKLKSKGVGFKILDIQLDTSTATGKLMLTTLGAIATFEREMMLERQAEGIAKAKQRGAYKGRKPTARMQATEVKTLVSQGLTKEAIAEKLNIGVASVYRILREAKAADSVS